MEVLWQAPALISVVVAGEGLALLLALAPGLRMDRLIYFGLASLVIQWIALLTLGFLSLNRRRISTLAPQEIAWVALALLLASTWLTGGAAWLLLGSGALSWPIGGPVDDLAQAYAVGASANAYLGRDPAVLGDVSGDGLGEWVVGAQSETQGSTSRAGAVYVHYGP